MNFHIKISDTSKRRNLQNDVSDFLYLLIRMRPSVLRGGDARQALEFHREILVVVVARQVGDLGERVIARCDKIDGVLDTKADDIFLRGHSVLFLEQASEIDLAHKGFCGKLPNREAAVPEVGQQMGNGGRDF